MKARISTVLFWIAMGGVLILQAICSRQMILNLRAHVEPASQACWPVNPIFSVLGGYLPFAIYLVAMILKPDGYRTAAFFLALALGPAEFVTCEAVTGAEPWPLYLAWAAVVVVCIFGGLEVRRRSMKARATRS